MAEIPSRADSDKGLPNKKITSIISFRLWGKYLLTIFDVCINYIEDLNEES